jgi:ABC-type antimicrobial peptide transport system permease subunit
MALGAQATHVRWLFLKTSAWVVVGGLAVGLPASLAVGRLLQNNVVRFDPRDPVMLIAIVAVLAVVAFIASIVPARRATRLEPTIALRDA